MYIAMNRFKVKNQHAKDFENIWTGRETRLKEMPGFVAFQLLHCDTEKNDAWTLYATHTLWDDKQAFLNWTESEQFRDSHKNAGSHSDYFADRAHFEGFNTLLGEHI